jgi:hypothetical protein
VIKQTDPGYSIPVCRQEPQRGSVTGPDDRDVPVVEGGDLMHAEALGDCDHRGVRGAEREVGVGLDQAGHAVEVGGGQRDER